MKYLIMVLLLVMVIPFTPIYRNQLAHVNDIQKEGMKEQSSTEEIPEPIPKEEIECLSRNIYHEARGEGHVGMTAVAMVTLNRVKDPRWPKTVCKVVYQPYQFSWTHQKVKVKDKRKKEITDKIATDALLNKEKLKDPTHGSVFYHANYVKPSWSNEYRRVVVINNHIFYK